MRKHGLEPSAPRPIWIGASCKHRHPPPAPYARSAKALVKFLTTPASATVIRKHGLETG